MKPDDPGVPQKRSSGIDPQLHRLLHRLWTKAVDTEDYVKAEWLTLEAAIVALGRRRKDR